MTAKIFGLILAWCQIILAAKQRKCDLQKFKADPEDLVNILGGTNSRYDLSRGSTLPLIGRPWGFNTFAPQTDDDPTWPGWWFHPQDRRYFGLRLTHQPSPWISDYGNFLMLAYIPSNPSDMSASGDKYTAYSPLKSVFSPYYFKTPLLGYGNSNGNLVIEFTPSLHGGIMRATFPKYIANEVGDVDDTANKQLRRVAFTLPLSSDKTSISKSPVDGTTMISGYTTHNSGGVGDSHAAFAHYFVAMIYKGDGTQVTTFDETSIHVKNNTAWVQFSPEDSTNDVLTVRIATSFISQDQAITTYLNELNGISFDELKTDAKAEWHAALTRVTVADVPQGMDICDASDLYTTFYSSLYRASLFPRLLGEVDSNGNTVHWTPYASNTTSRVQNGQLSTDSGFWDAWNTIYPLLTLNNRPQLANIINGWIAAYKEGGWLPKWASPGYRGSMIGTMQDVSLADAIVKDIPNIDVQTVYESIRKDAFVLPPQGVDGVGRVCLDSYLKYGYVPVGAPMTTGGTCYEVVSRSLNYIQSDYAIAQAAQKLGYTDDYNTLILRSQNYTKLFDSETGFFRSKMIDTEKWTVPFDQFGWGGDYTEAGPWQFRFYVPHDPVGLANTYKQSNRDMCQELLTTQTLDYSIFHLGGYGSVIHEQTEMADHCFGQYAHNNQPSHYMQYMHMINGYTSSCSTQGRYYIRKTLLDLYTSDDNMFPGDEDNGEMGAWFVLSAMGLYERAPGSNTFEFGIPLFSKIEVDISDNSHLNYRNKNKLRGNNDKKLVIVTENNTLENVYVESILWNGVEIDKSLNSIAYSQLAQGGTLTFKMGPSPYKKQ